MSAAQYGTIPANPAEQNNQFVGGNPDLTPEQADTYTVGLVFTPLEDLNVAIDYYDVKIEETITGIGASTILNTCLTPACRRCAVWCVVVPAATSGWQTSTTWSTPPRTSATCGLAVSI